MEQQKADEKLVDEFLLVDKTKTRPINNYSTWVSAWQKAGWRILEDWRERWQPEEMYGARPDRSTHSVTFNRPLDMGMAVMKKKSCGIISIDWAKFFDRLEEDIGKEFSWAVLGESSSRHAKGYADA